MIESLQGPRGTQKCVALQPHGLILCHCNRCHFGSEDLYEELITRVTGAFPLPPHPVCPPFRPPRRRGRARSRRCSSLRPSWNASSSSWRPPRPLPCSPWSCCWGSCRWSGATGRCCHSPSWTCWCFWSCLRRFPCPSFLRCRCLLPWRRLHRRQ